MNNRERKSHKSGEIDVAKIWEEYKLLVYE